MAHRPRLADGYSSEVRPVLRGSLGAVSAADPLAVAADGPNSITVPGLVDAWATMHAR